MKAQKRRYMKAEDLYDFEFVNDPQISPDGRRIVYVLKRIDSTKNKYFSNLWITPFIGGYPKQLTFGDHADYAPHWSPNSSLIAFFSTRGPKEKSQIYLINPDGGEAYPVTDLDGAFQDMSWAPDRQSIVFSFRLSEPAKKKTEPENYKPPYHITRLMFREDGTDKIISESFHIYELTIKNRKVKQLTKGSWDDILPQWEPSGKEIGFLSNRIPDRELDPENVDIWFINPKNGKTRKIDKPRGPVEYFTISQDGKYLAYSGHTGEMGRSSSCVHHIWMAQVDGRKKAWDLMPDLDATTRNVSLNDLKGSQGFKELPVFSRDNKYLYFLIGKLGTTNLFRIITRSGQIEKITDNKWEVATFSANQNVDRFALIISQPNSPCDIFALTLRSGTRKTIPKPTMLVKTNESVLNSLELSKPNEIWVDSSNGTKIQGWYLTPPGFDEKKKWPMLLEIHGGPHLQYAYNFFHEFQFLAAQGYIVLYVNPRGSHGYGEKFSRAIDRNWGGPDYEDLMNAVDFMIAKGFVDEKRVGVLGGSYGGFMTNWIVGHTNRFAAAVTQRSLVNIASFFGTCDVGLSFMHEMSVRPWEDSEYNFFQSPLSYTHKMNTPLLIIHSENDHRTPIEQAEQLFTALKIQNKTVELVRFPGEGHELSRGGQPLHRVDRLQWVLKWFDRYLKTQVKRPKKNK
ncbi:MAG: hypothetical protein A2161_03105 [Candidatus Schekmanbacteria bacterium RBG_13_48_7]|uniref:Acyl-peptide hydrolase n=1 Tax=Candidatus Schekmanbacteria bacterium RBG_13_48_7 TaxID=1817878 RepID=A0A1F7RY43_9BACT|nr:MAG: hypothetical protein A2161_03105 [Candidatus Schekmanbacteria bacterium RBG_13_48_7]